MKTVSVTAILACMGSIASAVAADLFLSARIPVLGSFAGLQYTLNPGIAWGIRLPNGIQEGLIILALIAVASMGIHAKEEPKFSIFNFQFSIPQMAFGLVLGGGVANIIDRVRDGVVTDYFQIGSFPVFNVADSFVTIGVALLLVEAVLKRKMY